MSTKVTEGEICIDVEGGLSLLMVYLMDTIADCKTWQGLVSLDNPTLAELIEAVEAENPDLDRQAALDKIEMYAVRDEGAEIKLPSCLISLDPRWIDSHLGPGTFQANGFISVAFVWGIPAAYLKTSKVWYLDALSKLSRIIQEIKAQEYTAERITPDRIHLGRTGRLDPNDFNGQHAFLAELMIEARGEINV